MDELVQQGDAGMPVVEEKMLPQSQVDAIVKREKFEAAERARREMEAKMQQMHQGHSGQQTGMGGMKSNAFDPDQIKTQIWEDLMAKVKQAEEEEARQLQQQQQEEQAKQLEQKASEFHLKLQQGKKKFDDFDAVTKDLEPHAFPYLAFLSAESDSSGKPFDTAAIMYELAKDPLKLPYLDDLAKRTPNLALKELEKLARSIEQNEQALQSAQTKEPLSHLKSSSNVGVNKGAMTLRELKQAAWLKN